MCVLTGATLCHLILHCNRPALAHSSRYVWKVSPCYLSPLKYVQEQSFEYCGIFHLIVLHDVTWLALSRLSVGDKWIA